jgi:hypothetical protein
MWTWVLGTFLILHGVTRAFWPSYGPSHSWLLGDARPASVALWVIATLLFAATGLAMPFHQPLWRVLGAVAAVESLLLLVLFWDRGLLAGLAINVAILAMLWARRPSPQLLGA